MQIFSLRCFTDIKLNNFGSGHFSVSLSEALEKSWPQLRGTACIRIIAKEVRECRRFTRGTRGCAAQTEPANNRVEKVRSNLANGCAMCTCITSQWGCARSIATHVYTRRSSRYQCAVIRRDDYDLSHVAARSASLARRGLTTTAQFFLLLPLEGPLTTTYGTLVPTLLTLTIVSMISDAISQVFFSSQEDFRGCVERKSFSLATRFYQTGRGNSKPDDELLRGSWIGRQMVWRCFFRFIFGSRAISWN